MVSVCFYFQVHQPYRLRRFSFFEQRNIQDYFDHGLNQSVVEKVAEKCYLPSNRLLLDLCDELGDDAKFSFSVSGVALEQFAEYTPETLESFQQLADRSENIEFLAETYYHSLASILDTQEFKIQVALHQKALSKYLGITEQPAVFRNTELIYDDRIGALIANLGFKGVLAEGPEDVIGQAAPDKVLSLPQSPLRILAKNYQLSDDIAFRFCDSSWSEYPLSPEKFASWVKAVGGRNGIVNIFVDYETFGEHQWKDTGIFEFLRELPEALLAAGCKLVTPSEAVSAATEAPAQSYHRTTSWADTEKDLSAWYGNEIQRSALNAIFDWSEAIRCDGDEALLDVWRKLQTSDHFYYMCTKGADDGQVHSYFSPYDTPYDAFVNYMNCIRDFKSRFFSQVSKAA